MTFTLHYASSISVMTGSMRGYTIMSEFLTSAYLALLQTLSVELLNERKYSAILDDLNRFQEVHKQPQHLNL